ncbi:MAG TPA: glycosyltransferase [Planctomycetota bacterium]|nr:glycosyltransferase [Planctomycetota bacterium]
MEAQGQQLRLAGPFQQLVLLAVIRLGPRCHGGAIHRYIERRTGRWVSLKAVYTTLQRLEQRGYVQSWSRPPLRSRWMPDWKREGPTLCRAARRFYTIETLGRRALRLTSLASDRMQSGLPGFGREGELYSRYELTRSPRPLPRRYRWLRRQYGATPARDLPWAEIHGRLADLFRDDEAGAPEPEGAEAGGSAPALDAPLPPPIAWRPMERPRIALLLPVRRARRTLPAALADVLAQRDIDLTVWAIVDRDQDGQDDGSEEFLELQARADSRLRVLRGPGRGVGAALDVGLAAAVATGAPLLAHMEADDRCAPDRLVRLATEMWRRSAWSPAREPPVCAVTSRAGLFGTVTQGMRRYLAWQNSLLSHADLARERFVEIPALHQTGLYRVEAVRAIGGYAPRGAWPADIDFWLRWFEHDARVAPLRAAKLLRVLYRWRQHARQSTRSHGGVASAGPHGLDALRAAKAYYLSRWLGARPAVLVSTGATLAAWESALRAAGVELRGVLRWRPGAPPPAECRAARGEDAIVLAAYGSGRVRDRLRATLTGLSEPDELLFTA